MSSDESTLSKSKKETAILSESSLTNLSREISINNIRFYMNLGIPTYNIVIMKSENDKNGLPFQNLSQNLLLHWMTLRKNSSDKDKVLSLERALRASNEVRLADIVIERHQLNMDLVPSLFKET